MGCEDLKQRVLCGAWHFQPVESGQQLLELVCHCTYINTAEWLHIRERRALHHTSQHTAAM